MKILAVIAAIVAAGMLWNLAHGRSASDNGDSGPKCGDWSGHGQATSRECKDNGRDYLEFLHGGTVTLSQK